MESVQNALKFSFINQMSHKSPLDDDLRNADSFNGVVSDEFSVDDLLDFSKINGCEDDGDENENESIVVNDVVSKDSTNNLTTNAKQEIVADRNDVVVKMEASDICVPVRKWKP